VRLFAGIELDDTVRAACVNAQNRLRAANVDARYEPAEKLHVTLAFLGRIEAERRDDVNDVLRDAAARHTPFEIPFDRLGAFPNTRRPRIIYVGCYEAGAEFRTLSQHLRDAYRDRDFSFEADAVAHVTIARVKGGSSKPLPMLDVAPATLRVAQLVMFESLAHAGSTRYEVRERYDLSAARS